MSYKGFKHWDINYIRVILAIRYDSNIILARDVDILLGNRFLKILILLIDVLDLATNIELVWVKRRDKEEVCIDRFGHNHCLE